MHPRHKQLTQWCELSFDQLTCGNQTTYLHWSLPGWELLFLENLCPLSAPEQQQHHCRRRCCHSRPRPLLSYQFSWTPCRGDPVSWSCWRRICRPFVEFRRGFACVYWKSRPSDPFDYPQPPSWSCSGCTGLKLATWSRFSRWLP